MYAKRVKCACQQAPESCLHAMALGKQGCECTGPSLDGHRKSPRWRSRARFSLPCRQLYWCQRKLPQHCDRHNAKPCVPTDLALCRSPATASLPSFAFAVCESIAIESTVYTGVAQLRGLRSLHLRLHDERAATCSPEYLQPRTAHLARLSALSTLTHLHLDLNGCFQHTHDSWYENQAEDKVWHVELCEVRESHRTTLLFILAHMQQLQHLHCPTLWLTPTDAASLTALTSLTLGGLLPFDDGAQAPQARAAGGSGGGPTRLHVPSSGALPPLLQELHLREAASPRLLARLQLPSSLTRLSVTNIFFGMCDVTEQGWRVTQEAVQAVGPAVQRLVRYRGSGGGSGSIAIEADGSVGDPRNVRPSKMQPREGSPDGHSEWVRHLLGLDSVVGELRLENMVLSTEDLRCLGAVLPHLGSETWRASGEGDTIDYVSRGGKCMKSRVASGAGLQVALVCLGTQSSPPVGTGGQVHACA